MTICPCCNDTLLRYIAHNKIVWFCPSCWQEMPNIVCSIKPDLSQELTSASCEPVKNSSKLQVKEDVEHHKSETLVQQLPLLKSFLVQGKLRLHIVDLILSHSSKLIALAIGDDIYQKNTEDNNQTKKDFGEDGKIILGCLAYSFLVGDVSSLKNCCLNKLQKTYIKIGNSFIEQLKTRTLCLLKQVVPEESENSVNHDYFSLISELGMYFDTATEFLG